MEPIRVRRSGNKNATALELRVAKAATLRPDLGNASAGRTDGHRERARAEATWGRHFPPPSVLLVDLSGTPPVGYASGLPSEYRRPHRPWASPPHKTADEAPRPSWGTNLLYASISVRPAQERGPLVKPAPTAARSTKSPFFKRFCLRAVSIASGSSQRWCCRTRRY